jgi:ribosomal protein S18 acetylase RimI-like enzyme
MSLQLRPAEARDYETYVALFAELGVDHPPLSRERWLAEMVPGGRCAERGGVVVGYCYFQALKEAGYVRNLTVAPSARRQGVGRALMEQVARELVAGGARTWRLNVMAQNVPAMRLYESLRMRPVYRSNVMRFTWNLVGRLPGPARTLTARELADDAAVESAFGLPIGQLATARQKGGRVLMELYDGGVCGVAVFSPDFPGAFPFRVKHPTFARPLLDGLRPHARPGEERMGVVVEDDDALADLLVSAGATVQARMVHYEGPLPVS